MCTVGVVGFEVFTVSLRCFFCVVFYFRDRAN